MCDLDLGISPKKWVVVSPMVCLEPLLFHCPKVAIHLVLVPKKFQATQGSLEAEVQQDTMQLEQQKAKQAFDTRNRHLLLMGSEIPGNHQLIWQISQKIHYLLGVLYIPGG